MRTKILNRISTLIFEYAFMRHRIKYNCRTRRNRQYRCITRIWQVTPFDSGERRWHIKHLGAEAIHLYEAGLISQGL